MHYQCSRVWLQPLISFELQCMLVERDHLEVTTLPLVHTVQTVHTGKHVTFLSQIEQFTKE